MLKRLVGWYRKYERPLSSLSLGGGFVFDALTLRRVDTFWENFWIIIHLLVVAAAILVLNRKKSAPESELDFWLVNLLQFTFGGLLSAFLVFYFRSATFSVSWPFLLLLAIAFLANERLKKHFGRLAFQVSLFYLSLLLFAIFIVPVAVGSIGDFVFVLSGVLSLVMLRLFLIPLGNISKERFLSSRKALRFSILGIFALVNILYFTNLIPPIPLSLKDGGIYTSVERAASGDYILSGGDKSLADYFRIYEHVRIPPGGILFAYTAIFSPGRFSTNIIHEWQYWSEDSGSWVTQSRVALPISGGRGEGYRTYSEARVVPGKWRVNVLTLGGQVIGRIDFIAE